MKPSFVAGFGPIVRDVDPALAFWRSGLGIEMNEIGHPVLRGAREEPWHQTTARLLSPEGLLVGVTYTPWMHKSES